MSRPNTSAAVKAQRAPALVEADDPTAALYRTLDFFPTPPWAARAGAELIRVLDPEAETVWEPACGQGHMAAPLGQYFEDVAASDIHPFGYGAAIDFLDDTGAAASGSADWIVTNPPFKPAAAFIRLGLERARRGVAMLLRLQALEGEERYQLIHGPQPMTTLAPFSERVSMVLGQWDPEASQPQAYAWFLWLKGAAPRPMMAIPPGTKRRLTRADDAARFGVRREAGLLDRIQESEVRDQMGMGA
jgi:hypothetical protein